MSNAEAPPDHLLIVGRPAVIEVVAPAAAKFEFQTITHDTIEGAIDTVDRGAEGLAAAVIDMGIQLSPGGLWVRSLLSGLQIKSPDTPTAIVANEGAAIGHFRTKYNFGDPTELRAAITWPVEAAVVRDWLTNVVWSRAVQAKN